MGEMLASDAMPEVRLVTDSRTTLYFYSSSRRISYYFTLRDSKSYLAKELHALTFTAVNG